MPSSTPSPSLSGQPCVLVGPAASGHRSLVLIVPSPSRSGFGQPLNCAIPASFRQLSRWSGTPSPSLSILGVSDGAGVSVGKTNGGCVAVMKGTLVGRLDWKGVG